MVNSTVEKLSPTRVKLNITVTPEELKPSIAHAYEHIAQDVQIPGFRKGKVPAPIIDQRVGRGVVLEHAVSEGLDTFYRDAINEHAIPALDVHSRSLLPRILGVVLGVLTAGSHAYGHYDYSCCNE